MAKSGNWSRGITGREKFQVSLDLDRLWSRNTVLALPLI